MQHKLRVSLSLGDEQYRQSSFVIYNEVKHDAAYNYYKSLYAGLLDKKVVQKICLKENSISLTGIPNPSPVLARCIIRKEINEGPAISGQRLKIRFIVVDAVSEEETIDVDDIVNKFDFCPEENSTGKECENNDVAVVVGLLTSVLFTAIVTALMLSYRKKRSSEDKRPGQVDENPCKGHSEDYYQGRERVQVDDTSPCYGVRDEGWEDCATDENTYFQ